MKSFAKFCCITVLLSLSTGACCSRRHNAANRNIAIKKNIEKPFVEAFLPRGLRVSIPDFPGMERFAFHGNINAPMRPREGGALSKDVDQSTNGRWVFEEKTVQLRVGDVVNYWIYAQVYGKPYRVDNLSEIIKELSPHENFDLPVRTPLVLTDMEHRETSTYQPQVCSDCNAQNDEMKAISNKLSATLNKLEETQMKVEPLQTEIERLKKLLVEVTEDLDIGTKLMLVGQQPPLGNPLEAIRNLIVDKLELLDLEETILSAQRTGNGVVFEVKSSFDKKRILSRAKKLLENSNYKIVDVDDPQTAINGQYLLDEREGTIAVTRQ